MSLRTPYVLAGLGSDEALDLAVALLDRPRTIGELAQATGLPQVTVSRRIAVLRAASLVEHGKRKGVIRLRDPDAVRRFLLSASELSGGLAGGDADSEDAFRRRLREASSGS